MPKELVYTSSIQGLKQGSRGFCTVAMSPALPPNLIVMLESLSGYRHLYPPNTPEAARNPVVFSHLSFTLTEKEYHVFSRVADAGLDYSGRTNKIADHLVFDAAELPQYDPVSLLKTESTFLNRWEGSPRLLNESRPLIQSQAGPAICSLWKTAAGDPGWAGHIAASVEKGRSVVLIYRPGQNIAALIAEAIALLPPALRWKAGFHTFCSKIPPRVNCLIKAAPAGTPEESGLRALPDSLTIDLTRNPADYVLNELRLSDLERRYIHLARTGEILQEKKSDDKVLITRKVPLVNGNNPFKGQEDNLILSSMGKSSPLNVEKPLEFGDRQDTINLLDSYYEDLKKKEKKSGWISGLLIGISILLILTGIGLLGYCFVYKKGGQNNPPVGIPVSSPSEDLPLRPEKDL
ncbi:MAG: hypothetical protein Q4G69_02730 [Planctomycetia bacterium]|nr:hypothetical protein [Planctomycetia bacterium]